MKTDSCDTAYYVALRRLDLHPRRHGQLMERFGGARALWQAPAAELAACDEKTAQRLQELKALVDPEAEMERLRALGLQAVMPGSPGYPANLTGIYDPPEPLFVRGKLLPEDARAVAVVGSRRCTVKGREITRRIASGLAASGVTVVSGLARGIDTAAHIGALEAGGRTIAVLGCGLDIDYPPENGELAARIAASGAVVSEFCPGTTPLPWHFPQRNRIISGLSLAVVVVEAGERSGALVTADLALEQGREVMAVPGGVDSFASRGPHRLIRQGALLVAGYEDILEALGQQPSLFGAVPREKPSLTPEQEKLLEFLDYSPRHPDEIAALADRNAASVSSDLTWLELKGYIKQLPGSMYVRD